MEDTSLVQSVFDALPSPIFIVDRDVRVLEYNAAAQEFLGAERTSILMWRGGEVLHCMHAGENPRGCGNTESCKRCPIRQSVDRAFDGQKTVRRRAGMEIYQHDMLIEFFAMISVSPLVFQGRNLAALVIEDINETIELQGLLPICYRCKKVRQDTDYWVHVEEYLRKNLDIHLSHGLCPECLDAEVRGADGVQEDTSKRIPANGETAA